MNTEYTASLDVGDARIGVAITDDLGISAHPLQTITRKSWSQDVLKIKEILKARLITKIIIGLPLNMNGTEGKQVLKTKKFAERLKEELKIPCEFLDERLTTKQAEKDLISSGMRREKRKKQGDAVAATLILQNYLDRREIPQRHKDPEFTEN